MPAGLIIHNEFGTVQIDDTSPNLSFKDKGNVPMIIDANTTIALPTAVSGTVMALSCPVYCQLAAATEVHAALRVGLYPTNVLWWRFGPPIEPGANYGLVVRDAAGALMFDATQKPARVVDAVQIPIGNNFYTSRTYPAGRDYAVLLSDTFFRVNNNFVEFNRDFTQPANKPARTAIVLDVTGY